VRGDSRTVGDILLRAKIVSKVILQSRLDLRRTLGVWRWLASLQFLGLHPQKTMPIDTASLCRDLQIGRSNVSRLCTKCN